MFTTVLHHLSFYQHSLSVWELRALIALALLVEFFSILPSCNDFSCSTVRGLGCRILLFIMRHTFSVGDRSGLRAGQYTTYTLILRRHAVVTRAECGLAFFFLLKYAGTSLKKTLLGWQHV